MMATLPTLRSLAIVGGTGKMGMELAYRWARVGYSVCIGSRSADRARSSAMELNSKLKTDTLIEGCDYKDAAQRSDLIVLCIPYSSHREILENLCYYLQGKLLIDITVPLSPSKKYKVQMPASGSAALEAHQILGPGVEVCTAFQNISHGNLHSLGNSECEVLVTGTSPAARNMTLELVGDAGFKGWDAGPIENSAVVEGLTSILIHINRLYQSSTAGIKIIGV